MTIDKVRQSVSEAYARALESARQGGGAGCCGGGGCCGSGGGDLVELAGYGAQRGEFGVKFSCQRVESFA